MIKINNIVVYIRLVIICLFVFIDIRWVGLGSLLIIMSLILGYRKAGLGFIHFSQFMLDKILYFAILIVLIERGLLNVTIVIWLVAGEFIDSGSKLLLVSKNLSEKSQISLLGKSYFYLLLACILYLYPTFEEHFDWHIAYVPFLSASVLVLLTAYYVYRSMTHKMLQSLFRESGRE